MWNFLLLCVYYIPLVMLFNMFNMLRKKKHFQGGGGGKLVFFGGGGGGGNKLVFWVRKIPGFSPPK